MLLLQSYAASQALYTFHKVAQFKSFVKVFVPGGSEGGRDSWLRNMTRQNAWLRKVDVTSQMKLFVITYFDILFLIGPQ